MVDAFASSGAADPRGPRALANVPQRGMSAEAIVAPYRMTAEAVGYLGHQLDEATVDWHRQAAEDAVVTRGADGKVELQRRPFELTRGDQAYNAVIMQRSLGQGQNDLDRQRTDLMLKHQNDPQGFMAAAEAAVKGVATSGNKLIRGQLSAYAAKTFGEAGDKLKIDKYNTDQQSALATIQSRIKSTGGDLVALARDGGTDSDAYRVAFRNMQDLTEQLSANPAFGYSKERVAEDMKRWESLGRGMAAAGGVTKAFKEGGDVAARKFIEENIQNNTALTGLSDPDRAHIATFATSKLAELRGERQVAIESLKPTVDAFQRDFWQKGIAVPDDLYDAAWKRANDAGWDAGIAALSVGRRREQLAVAARGAPDAAYPGAPAPAAPAPGRTRYRTSPGTGTAFNFFVGKGWSKEAAAGIVGNLLAESGLNTSALNPGDGSDGTDSIGMAQWNSSRAVALKAFAVARGKPWQDLETQLSFVDHELRTSHSGAGNALRSAKSVEDATAAFVVGFERPKGSDKGAQNAHNWKGRLEHARGIAQGAIDGFSPSAPSGGGSQIPYSPEQIKANPHLVPAWLNAAAGASAAQVKWADDTTSGLIKSLQHDQKPNEDLAAAVMQIARANPTETALAAKIEQMTSLATGGAVAAEGGNMTESAGAAYMTRVRKLSDGGSLYHQMIARDAEDAYKRRATRLKNDPVAEGADRGWHAPLPPIDMTAPPARLSETIAAYGAAAAARGAVMGNPMQSAFGPNEIAQVKAVASTGSPDQRLQLLSAISQMPEAVRNATLQQIGAGGEQAVFAFAGGLAQEAPDIARSLIMGHAAMTAKEGYIPKTGANATSYRSSKDTALPVTAFPPSMRMDGSGPFAAMSQAIDARYAYLAAQAGDTTGKPNETRLRQSVNDVTGGIVWQNGAAVIAPARGMDQRTFDGVMAGLTDADLAGVTTGNGRPITADYVRSTARLHAVGAARYLVVLNRNDEAPQYAAKDGQAFVLSLKDRQPAEVYRPRDRLDPNLP